LDELTKVTQSQGILPTVAQISTAAAPNVAAQPEPSFVVPEEFNVPAEEAPQEQQQQQSTMAPTEGGFVIPEEFQQQQQQPAAAPSVAPMQKTRTEMSRDVLNTELTKLQGALANTTDPVQQGRLQRDLAALQREMSRLK
jgi:hypothetical protein